MLRITLAIVVSLFCSLANAAPPILGADCGIGATITGSKNAGKVIIGDNSDGCTLYFSWPKTPSCSATLESTLDPGGSVYPHALGTITTNTTLFISDSAGYVPSLQSGYVIAYLCVGQ